MFFVKLFHEYFFLFLESSVAVPSVYMKWSVDTGLQSRPIQYCANFDMLEYVWRSR